MYIDYVRVYQKGVGVIEKPANINSLTVTNPVNARCIVYGLNGKIIGDYTHLVKGMKKGEDLNKVLSDKISKGIYLVKLYDNGNIKCSKFIATAK
jgi:hypothetical protein